VLHAVNDLGPSGLAVRREIVKRVVEFQSFEKCYEDKAMAARGGVQAIREFVNAKDTVTRLAESAERERSKNMDAAERKRDDIEKRRVERAAIKADFYEYRDEGSGAASCSREQSRRLRRHVYRLPRIF
jgi:hypothetical protein